MERTDLRKHGAGPLFVHRSFATEISERSAWSHRIPPAPGLHPADDGVTPNELGLPSGLETGVSVYPPNRRPLVVVTRAVPRSWVRPLADHCQVVMGTHDSFGWQAHILEALPRAEGLLTMLTEPVDAALLDRAPNVRVISNMAVGYDNIDRVACARRGIPVGHTPRVSAEATADMTWALMLSVARRIPEAMEDARADRWHTWLPAGWLGKDVFGGTLGIVGMGDIGRAVARRARGFDMEVLFTSRSKTQVEGAEQVELDELLEYSDYVCLHCPLTPATRHLIGARELARMKSGAVLVNMARGPVVDKFALTEALMTGQIGAAALDVTDPEPLPADDPLYRLPNCIIVPHIGSATVGARKAMARLAVENLLAGLRGEPLPCPAPLPSPADEQPRAATSDSAGLPQPFPNDTAHTLLDMSLAALDPW